MKKKKRKVIKHRVYPKDLKEIRKLLSWGMKQRELAEIFGVSQSTISRIGRVTP